MLRTFSIVLAAGAGFALFANEPVVGMLEQRHCYAEQGQIVRALFVKQGNEWRSLRTPEAWAGLDIAARQWTMAFDGRARGTLRTVDTGFTSLSPNLFASWRFLNVRPGDSTLRIKSTRFSGWCNDVEYRPIVLVSGGSAADPDAWKPFQFTPSYRDTVLAAFRSVVPNAETCDKDGRPAMLPVVPGNLRIKRGYRSAAGARLVWVQVDLAKNPCDSEADAWAEQVFVVNGGIRHLGHSIDLVDAGDYDNDGRSEIIFAYNAYNRGGYQLFYGDLTRHADYIWGYH
jgi:hypothetical protein